MAIHVGKVEEFDGAVDDWPSYMERLEHFFDANKIGAEQKKAAFLACIGKRTYGLLRALTVPGKPADKTYKELVELLTKHLAPKPLLIAERYRFHKRDQKEGESIREYVANLQKLTEHCQFGAGWDDALRDRIVCGIRDEVVRKRLLSKAELTFAKAVEIIETEEVAVKDAGEMKMSDIIQVKTEPQEVNQIPTRSQGRCYRCGGNHQAHGCPFIDQQCHFCKKKGHIARVCKAKKRTMGGSGSDKMKDRRVKELSSEATIENEEEAEVPVYWGQAINKRRAAKEQWKSGEAIMVGVLIEGLPVQMELDTGAAIFIAIQYVSREV